MNTIHRPVGLGCLILFLTFTFGALGTDSDDSSDAPLEGLKTLDLVSRPGFFDALDAKTQRLVNGLLEQAQSAQIALRANQVGGMFGLFFTHAEQVRTFEDVTACDLERFKRFFLGMLQRGIYLAPSAFESGFVSAAHSDEDIETTLSAAKAVLAEL